MCRKRGAVIKLPVLCVFFGGGNGFFTQITDERIRILRFEIGERTHAVCAVGNGNQINCVAVFNLNLRIVRTDKLCVRYRIARSAGCRAALLQDICICRVAAVSKLAVLVVRVVRHKCQCIGTFGGKLFILQIDFIAFAVIGEGGKIIVGQRQIHLTAAVGRADFRYGYTVCTRSKG